MADRYLILTPETRLLMAKDVLVEHEREEYRIVLTTPPDADGLDDRLEVARSEITRLQEEVQALEKVVNTE